ncbi:hypothetical protein AV530_002147 [Patagioenas fasciata monilis]|uniref:Mos1 transposase HTH domain-containing protein n=1 Tax=Patagioenas fasciata monilis TaxID=372326 RepID=A0A1V4JZ64_PATFA|nr:hypothetical protein AV530_002147 [Patagioenas fasciata monilis]
MVKTMDKKQIPAIFLFKFKMGHKAVETTHNLNTFGTRTANECTLQQWFKKFHKEVESLEDEERSDWPAEAGNDRLRATMETDPLTTAQEVAEELNIHHSTVIRHLKQIGKVKKLDQWVSQELTENITSFQSVIFSSMQQQ